MRRPAQHRFGPTAHTAWAHPYTGVTGLAVFYNDGGNTPPAPPAGDPNPAPVPKPSPPPVLKEFTQEDLERVAAKEKSQGERAGARKALEDFAAEHGFTNTDDAAAFIKAARAAEDAKKTEDQRRQEELDKREQELATREQQAVARERAANRRAVLVGLGATGDDLEDAAALLRVDDAADQQALETAAAALKTRRPELFGAARQETPPPQLPPAPGGAPAGGPPKAPASKDDIKARALARAAKMGYAPKPDAA